MNINDIEADDLGIDDGWREPVINFDSDEPIKLCPLNPNPDESCEACQ